MLLSIKNLRKSFGVPDGSVLTVVDVPGFTLDTKQQTALCGTSGTGKTTFLNLIAGILQPDEGRIDLDGSPISEAGEADRDQFRARTIGYIFQTFNLLQGYTCIENVLLGMSFGSGADRRWASELLERVGLGQRLDHFPRQLSTGQQQRVAVARALANRPKLVLADEPTGNLDEATSDKVLAQFLELVRGEGSAALVATHNERLAARMDRVVRLHEGVLVDGPGSHSAR